jgi:hypothetical protein
MSLTQLHANHTFFVANAALAATAIDMDYEELNAAISQSGMDTAFSLQ